MNLKQKYHALCIKTREKLNPLLGPLRRRFLGANLPFTIISNNCWAGHVYRYYDLPYDTPTVGLYFFSDDYIKFVSNLKYYMCDCELRVTDNSESKYRDILLSKGGENAVCPVGHLDDIEIIFLHYKTKEEAESKWNRRKERIHWDNLIIKNTEMNGCTLEHMKQYDSLPFDTKIIFTTKDYGLKSQIVFKEFAGQDQVKDDTTHFRRYINLNKLINRKI